MEKLLLYKSLLSPEEFSALLHMAEGLKGKKIIHVNSTKEGGGVAELLSSLVSLSQELGLDMEWTTIQGNEAFFNCTKKFHNLLQGEDNFQPAPALLACYENTNKENAKALQNVLQNADFVFIHDPQPLALIQHFPERKGKWVWRCHIDLSSPSKETWDYLKPWAGLYDAAVFSMAEFAEPLPCPTFIIPPGIDPFSEKNNALATQEIELTCRDLNIENRPFLLQVSRFDKWKDPLGVIQAFQIAKIEHPDLQLVLAGSGASDDPEGQTVFREVEKAAANDPAIRVLLLPPTSHKIINALQRGAAIVLQKSLKEGFGLTVAEALWKSKPVIGGNCGGIRLQIVDHRSGLLVQSISETVKAISFLLQYPEKAAEYGEKGRELVKERFLISRLLRDDLSILQNLKKRLA